MKKIYHLLAILAVALSFTACHPLDNTYKDLDDNPDPAIKTLNYTLASGDYKLLPSSVAASKSGNFASVDEAKSGIAAILNNKFFDYNDNSVANVTYTSAPVKIKLADSLYANIAYTVTNTDYTSVTGKYLDFSTAQAITFLNAKYPTPASNQMVVLNYTYYESGVTPSSGVPNTIHSYLYLNGAWTKIYTISPAQYAAAGRGSFNQFVSADANNLVSIFNNLLKADLQVSATAKAGDVIYVSYNYYASKAYQRVQPLTFDGTNWVTLPVTANTLTFVKANGKWIPDPTIYYNLVAADYTFISGLTYGSDAARANLAQYKNFNVSAGAATAWTNDDISKALIDLLKKYYPKPAEGQVFKVTYYAYSGSYSYPTMTFTYTGGNYIANK